jgi:hypothetical protein
VELVIRHRPDILFLGDLVTARHHIGRLKKQLERELKGKWFVTTNISASSGRPVGMGAIIYCSLAKHMLDCVIECPEGQNPQTWEAAVGGRVLNIKISRPDLPSTWHIIGVYQHVAKKANQSMREQVWNTLQDMLSQPSGLGISPFLWATSMQRLRRGDGVMLTGVQQLVRTATRRPVFKRQASLRYFQERNHVLRGGRVWARNQRLSIVCCHSTRSATTGYDCAVAYATDYI